MRIILIQSSVPDPEQIDQISNKMIDNFNFNHSRGVNKVFVRIKIPTDVSEPDCLEPVFWSWSLTFWLEPVKRLRAVAVWLRGTVVAK